MKLLSPFVLITIILLSVLFLSSSFESNNIDTFVEAAAKKKGGKKEYVEFYDLLMDLSKKMCSKLGPLINPKHHQVENFNWRTRCDLFYDALEQTAVGMGDTMVHELDLTQKQLVDSALTPQNFFNLVSSLKKGVKEALTNPNPRIKESDLELSIHQLLSQVILAAATQDPGLYQEMMKLPRDAARNAQAEGIRMPSYGIADMDELDEENFLTGEDLQWAQAVKSGYVSDEERERVEEEEKEKAKERRKTQEEEDSDFTDEDDEKLIDNLSKEHWLLE